MSKFKKIRDISSLRHLKSLELRVDFLKSHLSSTFFQEVYSHKLLLSLMGDLDIRNFLLSKCDLQTTLESHWESSKREDGAYVIDEGSLILERLIISLKGINDHTKVREKCPKSQELVAFLRDTDGQNDEWKTKARLMFEKYLN